ncbi:sensor histidine kinase [Embleya sp. NPDC050154]|uniref:sensor histidine kinase n=1 Tax=unclassified Embleya TaxID=2699296 RepID=UPI0037A944AB
MGFRHPQAVSAEAPGAGATASPHPEPLPRHWRDLVTVRAVRNDVLIALFACAGDVLNYVAPESADSTEVTPLGILLAVLGSVFLLLRRRYPVWVLTATVVTQAAFLLVVTPSSQNYGGAMVFALYTVARHRGSRDTAIAACACMAVQWLRAERVGNGVLLPVLADMAVTVLVVAIGIGVAKWQNQLALNRQLLAERAVTEERRRIARELHDTVSHHITTMNLMSGGARSTLTPEQEIARGALLTLEESGRAALDEMRQLLGVLRGTDADADADPPSRSRPGMEDIGHLIAESDAAGLPVDYEQAGEPRPLPPAAGLTLYRIVQEALTNTRKHAGDARACVRVRYLPDRVAVEVLDDGAGAAVPAGLAGSGYGLVGMRERVVLHGGTLETGHRPEGGFRVAADIPLPPVLGRVEDPARGFLVASSAGSPSEAEPGDDTRQTRI